MTLAAHPRSHTILINSLSAKNIHGGDELATRNAVKRDVVMMFTDVEADCCNLAELIVAAILWEFWGPDPPTFWQWGNKYARIPHY